MDAGAQAPDSCVQRQVKREEALARQVSREAAARDAALGRRSKAIKDGHLGPVLRRWINADVSPIADLMRQVARAYLAGDLRAVSSLLDTPTAELSGRERPLRPLMEWCLRGSSPGRGGDVTSYVDDLALAFMATVLTRIASDKCTLASALADAADALRDTCQGQFISHIHGATAMQALRERQPERWKQKQSLTRICARLASQVKPQLEEDARAGTLPINGAKKVLHVIDHKGEQRRLSLKVPDAIDWEIMSLCYRDAVDGATPESRSLWLGFAGMFLAAAQVVGGWFEISEKRTGRKGHTRTSKLLVLSADAHEAISKDVDRWMGLGFYAEPMIVEPEHGDYLTVKHKKVTGQKPPKGLLTEAEGTGAWAAAEVLATTPWTVNPHALAHLREHPEVIDDGDTASVMRLAEHRRLASEASLYLPTTMDFRGRLYYRTPWVSPQSADLGKALLCFPPNLPIFSDLQHEQGSSEFRSEGLHGYHRALISHMAGLYGGPSKIDKASYPDKRAWWAEWRASPTFDEADKPLGLRAAWGLMEGVQADRIPIQLDGTCNGLQHLSALFRDEQAAPLVNLTRSSTDEAPADLYGDVAGRAKAILLNSTVLPVPEHQWISRFLQAGIEINRSLCKGPVMVLPYGGTREAVRLSVKAAVIEQLRARGYALGSSEKADSGNTPWHLYEDDAYGAFKGREIEDHPLFNTDVGCLSGLIWDCISPAIPKAMSAMATLQAIGAFVGERGLSWRVPWVGGPGVNGAERNPLWVVQAKSKASRKQVSMRGFHLPDMVRRLTLMANSNEVDPRAHKTGIVANFIHSLDAAHLSASLVRFRASGGTCVGSVHDAVMVRPSEAALMGRILRETFRDLHEADPLMQPVRLISTASPEATSAAEVDTPGFVEYPNWHVLAEAAGVAFPERGSYQMAEVLDSAWFFS